MAIRSLPSYRNTYNSEAARFLNSGDKYIDNMDSGIFLSRGGILPIMFDFAKYYLNLANTSDEVANDALDYIIVNNR